MSLRFHGCTLDVEAHRLFRGRDEIHVSPKAFELLRALVENRPRAMSKAELLARVWPDVTVTEVSVARAVSELRDALGDDAEGRIIRTVHSHGYAFLAEVETDPPLASAVRVGRHPAGWLISHTASLPLYEGEQFIGRDPALDLYLDSPKISRRHARIAITATRATIEDLGSKNGSFVDNARIAVPTELSPGSQIQVGRFIFVFQRDASPASTETDM